MVTTIRRCFAVLLAVTLSLQLVGCSLADKDRQNNEKSDGTIYEEFIYDEALSEKFIQAQYIEEHLIYEDGIYEVTLGEQYVCQSYVIETVISDSIESNISEALPTEFEDYSIDWPKVLSQFAVGTSVILAVGVINHQTKGATVFIFGTMQEIATEAFVAGVIEATMQVIINCDEDDVSYAKVQKYAVEGFSEGYMWGAVSAVVENVITPTKLKSNGFGKLEVDNFGVVTNKKGVEIGTALYDLGLDQISVIDEAGNILGVFNSKGEEIVEAGKTALKTYGRFVKGSGENAVKYFTDAKGTIFRTGNDLLPNTVYDLNGYVYHTDEMGRIVRVTFDKLTLKPAGQGRKSLKNVDIEDIGKGFEQIGDQKGHIMGDRFNGDNSIANLVPMSEQLNQREYLAIENLWAKSLEEGKSVKGMIEFIYEGDSFRPGRMDIEYFIDGIETIARLFN